jgi:hypothetical protein
MKRIPILIFLAMLIAAPVSAANIEMEVSGRVNFDEWSIAIGMQDNCDVCIDGEWSGRVTLERSTDGGFTWRTFRTFDRYFCEPIELSGYALYRIGVRAGDLEDGFVEINLSK